jgi:hypothetical protein
MKILFTPRWKPEITRPSFTCKEILYYLKKNFSVAESQKVIFHLAKKGKAFRYRPGQALGFPAG